MSRYQGNPDFIEWKESTDKAYELIFGNGVFTSSDAFDYLFLIGTGGAYWFCMLSAAYFFFTFRWFVQLPGDSRPTPLFVYLVLAASFLFFFGASAPFTGVFGYFFSQLIGYESTYSANIFMQQYGNGFLWFFR